jgi:hypothetical protein
MTHSAGYLAEVRTIVDRIDPDHVEAMAKLIAEARASDFNNTNSNAVLAIGASQTG